MQVFGQEAVVGGKKVGGVSRPSTIRATQNVLVCVCVCISLRVSVYAHGISLSVQMQRITLRAINI